MDQIRDETPRTPIRTTTLSAKKTQTTYVWTFNIGTDDYEDNLPKIDLENLPNDFLSTPINIGHNNNDDQFSMKSKTPNSLLDKMNDFSPYRKTTDQKRFDNSPISPSLWKKIQSSFKKPKQITSTPLSNIFQNSNEKGLLSAMQNELPEHLAPLMDATALFRNEFLEYQDIDMPANELTLYDKYNSEFSRSGVKNKFHQEQIQLATYELKRRPNPPLPSYPAPKPLESSEKERGSFEGCNCRSTHCLKMYCECLRKGLFCNGCNCSGCENHPQSDYRQEKVKHIEKKNPQAFKPIIVADVSNDLTRMHNKGCNCRRSGCLKKYCECYQYGVKCSEFCKCLDCKNCGDDHDGSDSNHRKTHKKPFEFTGLKNNSS